jgi:hypothetical protein
MRRWKNLRKFPLLFLHRGRTLFDHRPVERHLGFHSLISKSGEKRNCRVKLLDLAFDAFDVGEMVLDRRQGRTGEVLDIGILSGSLFFLEECDGLLMVLDHHADIGLVESGARQ